jgi:hypothetical protein
MVIHMEEKQTSVNRFLAHLLWMRSGKLRVMTRSLCQSILRVSESFNVHPFKVNGWPRTFVDDNVWACAMTSTSIFSWH